MERSAMSKRERRELELRLVQTNELPRKGMAVGMSKGTNKGRGKEKLDNLFAIKREHRRSIKY
jgi:hypothetical protein